ncbi:MAG: group 1 glycosyl transferase [candidate division Kazan bacterium GW2011_GWA1_50_15]|uniref:Glycosyl transferase group 1 n=2 Tax=Bacteria division Kazan-3B-28 TaxID=1798534 RepID=A0A0G1ZFN6_UNCK3|nr:MAG: group 1 glycosyl transferase [candidate division Kazan bacterium GW2011_GWA1_50_15]KKW25375.1 MAG: Glycosyl transferase group 1 [candidate division Kazan bacterium GW2011_GWC1_52_13]KKW26682.1 MAG: Glycosyl transferase group 1 [candidate division Kazan bacterium GW2011_GWB1_52_7]HAV65891.1 hypothetical protein [Patescibacteria group bacterium]HCR42863.1 hypothetical protein [Patescibacteria group bacterium]
MRIGVDIRGLLTGKISGVEQYTLQLLRHLLAIDTRNTYVLFYVSYKDIDQRLDKLLAEQPYLRAANVEVKKLRWVNFPILLHAVFKPLDWPKADVVCGGLNVMWMPSPMLLPLSRRCAKVTTFHDLIFYIYPQFYPLSSRIWQWQMNYPYEARTSDRVIAVSESTKQDLVRLLHVPEGKIVRVYEGVGEEYFVPPTPQQVTLVQEKFQVPARYFYYVGSVEPRKNLQLIVRAMHELQQRYSDTINLVVSGSKSWLSSDLYQLVQDLGLQTRIVFTGQVSEAEKIALLASATALVFPSFYEGFGLMVLEAFASGCPVITSDVSALPEVAGDAALTIAPTDVAGLAEHMRTIINDPILRQRLIERGRLRARQFNWTDAAHQTLAVIEQAAHAKGD